MIRIECRYCDIGTGSIDCNGDQVCNGCGAEWASAKIEVTLSAEQFEQEQKEIEEFLSRGIFSEYDF